MYDNLLHKLRDYAKQYRDGETLGRAIMGTEDIMDEAADAIWALLKELDRKDKCAELAQRKQAEAEAVLATAKSDIAAILWLNGDCRYCRYAKKVEYSGASRLTCTLGNAADCRPEWKGADNKMEVGQ